MEDDADTVMSEMVLSSTELLLPDQTVDPAEVFTGAAEVISPARTENIPILSRGLQPMKAHSTDLSLIPEGSYSYDDASDSDDSVVEPGSPSYQTYVQVENWPLPRSKALPQSTKRSGLCYDVRMRFHTEYPAALDGFDGKDIHPEDPRRIFCIFEALRNAKLVADPEDPEILEEHTLFRVAARYARSSEICLVHLRSHYDLVKSFKRMSEKELVDFGLNELDSIYLHKLTYDCARLAAGGSIETCRAIVAGHLKNGIAVVRPPGHHAEHNVPSGFCFFNNVAVAARVCQRDFPKECRKVLVLDWDVHHGNGIQRAFEYDPNVLYISLHVYKNGEFYPSTDYGDHLHCGEGEGKGFNVNIPWADVGMGDGDYMFAFQEVVMPIAMEYDPDLVIISAGFDAADGDLLGGCHVTPPCYAHMTHMLMSLANGKVAVVLEGGYNLDSISKSALAVTRTLMGEAPDRMLPDAGPTPSPLGVSTVQLVQRQQARYWKCMYPKPAKIPEQLDFGHDTERLHDVIREWQAKKLWDHYNMGPLMINRSRISKSFDSQVVATPNYYEERPLLVLFHDPPDAQFIREQTSNRLEPHNTWLTDMTRPYIDWAVKHGFAVIDINIPKHLTDPDDEGEYEEVDSKEKRLSMVREVSTYLWENYIEVNDATHIFMMGIGEAYAGVIELIGSQEGCENRIDRAISFVCDTSIVSVRRPTDDQIAGWYHTHSLVYVAKDHTAWDPERKHKLRKKFGNLIKSDSSTITEMLAKHKDEIFQTLEDLTKTWRETQREKLRLKSEQHIKESPSIATSPNLKTANLALKSVKDEENHDLPMENGTRVPPIRTAGSPFNPTLLSPRKLPPTGFFSTSPKKKDVRGREESGAPRT